MKVKTVSCCDLFITDLIIICLYSLRFTMHWEIQTYRYRPYGANFQFFLIFAKAGGFC